MERIHNFYIKTSHKYNISLNKPLESVVRVSLLYIKGFFCKEFSLFTMIWL